MLLQRSNQFTLGTFEDIFDQHLEKVENRFDHQCDWIQESIGNLSSQSSTAAETFLDQLTRINANQRKIEDLLSPESPIKASLSQIEQFISKQNEGMTLLDKGIMIRKCLLSLLMSQGLWSIISIADLRSCRTIPRHRVPRLGRHEAGPETQYHCRNEEAHI
jgi:hypothetical protein